MHRRSGPEAQLRSWLQRGLKTLSQPCGQFLSLCSDGAQKAVPGLGGSGCLRSRPRRQARLGSPGTGRAGAQVHTAVPPAPGERGPDCRRSCTPPLSPPGTPGTWPEAGERGQAAAADDEVERESAHAPAQSGQPGCQLLHGIGALRGPPSRGPDGQSRAARAPRPPPPPGALAELPS